MLIQSLTKNSKCRISGGIASAKNNLTRIMAPTKRNTKKSTTTENGENGPVTRSSKQKVADVTTYNKLNTKSDRPITVVSKRGLKSDPKHYEELEKRFDRIEAKRKQNDVLNGNNTTTVESFHCSPEIWARRHTIFLVTHFNVFLYATCFFIQVGTLPVRYS